MRLWATSCLHLRPETLDATLKRVASDLEGVKVQWGGSDQLLLVGDIVDPTPMWKACLNAFVDATHGMPRYWVRGNNDFAPVPYLQNRVVQLTAQYPPSVYGHMGVNIAGTAWADHHDVATKDQESAFYSEMITYLSGSPRESMFVTAIASHYPFTWLSDRDLAKPVISNRIVRLFQSLRRLEHLVFGHVHPEKYYRLAPDDSDVADLVPKKIVVDGREIQVHLVSDHRERLIHPIMEIA